MSTKEDILKLASRELQEKGVNSLSFRELASTLGIKSSSIHYHFPQKDDLIQMLIRNYSEAVFANLEQIAIITPSGKKRLLALVDMISSALEKRQCTAGVLAAESAQISNQAKEEVTVFFERLLSWIHVEVREMGKSEKEAKIYSAVILSAIEGSLMLDCFYKRSDNLDHLRDYIEMI